MFKKAFFAFVVLFLLGYVAFFTTSRLSRQIQVTRTFDAPIDRAWALFTDPQAMKSWWSPKGYTAPVIQNDVRVGGKFLFSMKSPSGEMHYNTGTYTDILLNKKILSKMSFADENGNPIPAAQVGLPGKWPDEVEVLVEFTDIEGKQTNIKITETGIPLIMSVFAKLGWEQQFDKFAEVLKPSAN